MSDEGAGDQLCSEGDSVKWEHPEGGFLLEEVVSVFGTEKRLTIKHDGLAFESHVAGASSKKNKDLCLIWQDVICAVKDARSKSGKQLDSFTVHYIKHKDSNKLQVQQVQVTIKVGEVDKWISIINETCQKVLGRPRKAFVIINPISGSKTGLKVYQKKVAPLFDLAGIHTAVTITERSKHALELGEHQDFSAYDAIVIVGGDGLYQEVLLGLTVRIQKETQVDYNNPESVFAKPNIPFGIIPAGTGNGLAGWCHGTRDEITAALNIIRGENHKAPVLTVHSCGKFVTLCGMNFGYGEFSDVIKRSDELRWMGRWRYPYTLTGMLFKKPRRFKCIIEYCAADNDENQDFGQSSSNASAQRPEWKVYTGDSNNVCGFFAILCEHTIDGNNRILNPQASCIDLLIDFGCGRINLMTTFAKFVLGRNAAEPLPEKLDWLSRITGFRFRLIPDVADDESTSRERVRDRELECILNIDGEVVPVSKPDIDARMRSDFVSLYGSLKTFGSLKVK